MKDALRITALISAAVLLAGCAAQADDEASTARTNAQNELIALMNDQEFKENYNEAVSEESMEKFGLDLSEAYIGTPFCAAGYNESDGLIDSCNIQFNYPVMTDDKAALIIFYQFNEDGSLYHYGTQKYYSEELNKLVSEGGNYAIVLNTVDGNIYAISEADEVTLISVPTCGTGMQDEPVLSYAEASRFNNVVSKETLTAKQDF